MAERSVSLLAEQTHEVAKYDGQIIDVDDDVTRFVVWFDRTEFAMLNRDIALAVTFWRRDARNPEWLHAGESSTHGGRIISDAGLEYLTTKWSLALPLGKGRQVKVDVDLKQRVRVKAACDLLVREALLGVR